MSQDDKDLIIQGHDYDGIQELDHPLPGWWMATFFITIIFSFIYWIHYEFSGGQTIKEELQKDLARIETLKKNRPPAQDSEDELIKLVNSATAMDQGKAVFGAKCAVCHGQKLEGSIGPNLTDEYWLHGKGNVASISEVIRKGVLDKGMPNWDGQLKDEEIKSVAAFVYSQAGSNPPNAKGPQGDKVVRQ